MISDIYSAFLEVQKEQADTESVMAELSLGRKVRVAPMKKWNTLQERIQTVAGEYQQYKNDNNVLDFLRTMSYNINI